jgi:hypothetical protein
MTIYPFAQTSLLANSPSEIDVRLKSGLDLVIENGDSITVECVPLGDRYRRTIVKTTDFLGPEVVSWQNSQKFVLDFAKTFDFCLTNRRQVRNVTDGA